MPLVTSKKRIAKNTAYLYISSIFQLFLGLYMSRILLQTLGVKDFGLYGVVGSVVTLLNFLNIAMGSASSRFLTYELTKGDVVSQRRVYSAVFRVHAILACCLFILAETIGLWFVNTKMVVPLGRTIAANWVYQSSVLIGVLNIIQVPYNASVTAHEKMGFSSLWFSITYLLKFFSVVLLFWITFDKLIYYAIMMFVLSAITFIGFFIYCKRSFLECHLIRVYDNQLFKDILSFAGYSAFSSSSTMIRSQGASLMINKFFGVVMNASANIANMVTGYISGFTQNIITAFRPQIIKNYAINDIPEMQKTLEQCMKYSIAIFSLMAVPVGVEMDYVLKLWLGKAPDLSAIFCRIALIGSAFGLINMIMTIAVQATSNVKKNSLLLSFNAFLSLGVTLILLYMGLSTYIVFVVYAVTELINVAISMINVKMQIPKMQIQKSIYLLFKLFTLICITSLFVIGIKYCMAESFLRLIVVIGIYLLIFGCSFWKLMLDESVKSVIIYKLHMKS